MDGSEVSEEADKREQINYLVVLLTQAMLGLVTSSLFAVAVDLTPVSIRLYFAVREADPEVREDVDDIITDFEAFLDGPVPEFDIRISEGRPGPEWEGRGARQVFRLKPE